MVVKGGNCITFTIQVSKLFSSPSVVSRRVSERCPIPKRAKTNEISKNKNGCNEGNNLSICHMKLVTSEEFVAVPIVKGMRSYYK